MGWITPVNNPTDTICRSIFIPNDEQFIASVTGALELLTFPFNWTQETGISSQDAADRMLDMFNAFCFQQGVCRVVGEIVTYAGATNPATNFLPCDGASVLRADWPDLFAVIGTTYGSADSTHFNVPDLRGRVVLGVGTGSGLSTYNLGDTGGEEAHTLTTAEIASHSHTDTGHTHADGIAAPAIGAAITGVPVPSAVPAVGVTGIGAAAIANSGGGGGHENRQPYIALNFYIVAAA